MKTLTTIALMLVIVSITNSCYHNVIDYRQENVARLEIFSDKGGRVDWNTATNKILIDQPNDGRWDLYICNPDKSEMINLTESMTGKTYGDQLVESWQHRGQPAFHPTGEYLVFQVTNEHASEKLKTRELLSLGVNNDLWFMKSDGSKIQKLTNNPAGYSVLHPHFSHNGKMIMWAEKYNDDKEVSIFGAWRIKVADIIVDDEGNAELENMKDIQPGGPKWYESHGFSPDDSKIYFSGNLTTDFKANDIYEYDLESGELKNLTNSPSTWEEMYNICPTDKGTYSYISSEFFDWNNKWGWGTLRTELYINDNGNVKQLTAFNLLDPGNSEKLSKKHYFIGDHCWNPDGKSLLAILAEASIGNTNSKVVRVYLK